jgi:hypothetical protein
MRTILIAALCALPLAAQDVPGRKLALVIPNLFGSGGLTLPSETHSAHFDSAFQANFLPLNRALGSKLSFLPIPSPASGFTYTLDQSLGTYSRSAQSFGPILAERAETIGRNRFSFGFAYQHFRFDKIDGIPLNSVPAVFQHALTQTVNPEFLKDIITADNFIDVQIGQMTSYLTYGLSERVDISVAVPLVSATLKATSDARIRRIGTGADVTIHYFDTGGSRDRKTFSGGGTAQGIGDMIFRVKGTAVKSGPVAVALGADLRAPTGDEYNFLGSGSVGVKPFAVFSFHAGKVSPHANVAYQWNGATVLAGDVVTGRKERLPNQLQWAAGADIGVTQAFTVAADVLAQRVGSASRVERRDFTAGDQIVYPQIAFRKGSLTETAGAIGFKVNARGNLLVVFNLLIRMNQSGLHSRVAPLVGLSYTL